MRHSLTVASVLAFLMVPSRAASAQTAEPTITFTMPLNLTKVSPDITKIVVYCEINSLALLTRGNKVFAQVELPVSNGQVVTTVTVNVLATNLDNPLGKQATYGCNLSGFSMSLQRWDVFNEAHATPAFRLSPTPSPISGGFTW